MQVRGEKSTPQGLQKGPNSEPQGQGDIQQQQQHPCNDATCTFGDFIRKLTSSETILKKSFLAQDSSSRIEQLQSQHVYVLIPNVWSIWLVTTRNGLGVPMEHSVMLNETQSLGDLE